MADSHSTLYSFPSNSNPQSQLHGVYPYAPPPTSHPVNAGQFAYPSPGQSSQTWATEQVLPPAYQFPTAIQPLVEKPVSIVGSNRLQIGNWRNPSLLKKAHKRKPKAKNKISKMNQFVRCEICDVYCNSIELYEKHLSGKKHLKTLQKKYAPNPVSSQPTSQPVVSSSLSGLIEFVSENSIQAAPSAPIGEGLGMKKPKLVECGSSVDSVRVCTTCNVMCNSEKALADHLAGRRHKVQGMGVNNVSGRTTEGGSSLPVGEVLDARKQKLMEGRVAEESTHVCTVSNVMCNNDVVLAEDIGGKKNIAQGMTFTSVSRLGMEGASSVSASDDLDARNQKLMEDGVAEESTHVSTASNVVCNSDVALADDVAGKKNIEVATISTVGGHDNKGVSSVSVGEDLETKKMKLMQAGVAEGSVHICTACNVVCNSEVVFADHIAGKKHIAQVQRSACGSGSNPNQPNPPTAKISFEDIETKRQKVEGSGTPSEAVRVCALCNVVCNSDIVFNTHLAGQKHASMVKKLAETSMAGTTASPATSCKERQSVGVCSSSYV